MQRTQRRNGAYTPERYTPERHTSERHTSEHHTPGRYTLEHYTAECYTQNAVIFMRALAYKFSMLLKVVSIILSQHLIQQESVSALLVSLHLFILDSEHRLCSFL